MTRLAIDPVTRVGGHLRVEVEVEGGTVRDAWASATMYRGIEPILAGRDPRDAWLMAQRICGRCNGVHALASVRAVEHALGVTIPANARVIRNLLLGSEFVLDHVVQFYQQHALDWIDPAAALTADPAATAVLATSLSDTPVTADAAAFRAARDRLIAFAATGASGLFQDHEPGTAPVASASAVSPEIALMVMTHYLQALDWQRGLVRLQTFLGGKDPHPQTFLVGGSALAVPWGGPPSAGPGTHPSQIDQRAPAALSAEGLAAMATIAAEARAFVEGAYAPDVLAIARAYPTWATVGRGYGNLLAYGEFPLDDVAEPKRFLPRGVLMGGNLADLREVDQTFVAETTAHAYYAGDAGDAALRHPFDGTTDPRYAGPTPPFATLAGFDRYSWVKAPRYRGEPMEVGPLARVLVAYVDGRDEIRTRVDTAVSRLGLGPDVLFSTTGRMVARAVEAQALAGRLEPWIDELRTNFARGDLAAMDLSRWAPETWRSVARGWSLGEGPRGAVGHWVTIRDGDIAEYQVVDGSTWNASPRDADGRRGAVEEALIDTPVADPERPIEVLRTVHAFDPCSACGVQ